MTNFQRTAAWLRRYKKKPSMTEASVQIGVMIEEIVEALELVRTDKDGYALLMSRCQADLRWFARKLTSGESLAYVEHAKHPEFLKELCDIDVTVNAVAFAHGFDKDRADEAVIDSNYSKLDEHGQGIIMPGGKIGKSDNYKKPDLSQFA